jgi:hypothetical protein
MAILRVTPEISVLEGDDRVLVNLRNPDGSLAGYVDFSPEAARTFAQTILEAAQSAEQNAGKKAS